MENYKEKYEEAIKRAKEGKPLEEVFPELKESEDEKIRNGIIKYLEQSQFGEEHYQIDDDVVSEYISWLEKQDPKKHEDELEMAYKCADKVQYMKGYEDAKREFEKQGEQKELNLVKILKHYPIETELYSPLHGKLWLAEVNERSETITCYKHPLDEGCTRATLEQEDTVSFYSNGTTGLPDFNISEDCMLFLYDIKKASEQKPAWSEEDEKMVGCIRGIIERYAFFQSAVDVNGDLCEREFVEPDDWLRSLKERYTWKPSDEQIEAFEHFVRNIGESGYASPYDNNTKLLYLLLEQLKKINYEFKRNISKTNDRTRKTTFIGRLVCKVAVWCNMQEV